MQASNNGADKSPRTPGTMSKPGPICCETAQKSLYEDVIERHKAQAWQERTWVRHRKPRERCEDA